MSSVFVPGYTLMYTQKDAQHPCTHNYKLWDQMGIMVLMYSLSFTHIHTHNKQTGCTVMLAARGAVLNQSQQFSLDTH